MNVVILPQVAEYLDDLAYKLYLKGYFGFTESAHKYIDRLIDDIYLNLPYRLKKPAPGKLKKYGTHYVTFKPNKNTTWYVFFISKGYRYIVRYITNNHVSAQHIRGLK